MRTCGSQSSWLLIFISTSMPIAFTILTYHVCIATFYFAVMTILRRIYITIRAICQHVPCTLWRIVCSLSVKRGELTLLIFSLPDTLLCAQQVVEFFKAYFAHDDAAQPLEQRSLCCLTIEMSYHFLGGTVLNYKFFLVYFVLHEKVPYINVS